jgi:Bacterial pre-peptidase C-terminal domain
MTIWLEEIPADTSTTAGTATEQSQTSFIEVAGDHDWFRTTLASGTTYVFTQNGSGANPLADSYLRLRDSAGTQIAFDDDSGGNLNSRLEYTATRTGTYYLDAGAFADAGSGEYTLGMSEVDDIADGVSTARRVSVSGVPNGSGSGRGRINSAADQDWFRISLRAGELYEFRANDAGGTTGIGDPTLSLRNSSGTQLAFNDDISIDDGNLNSRIRFRPTASGTYFLDVGGFSDRIGNYRVTAREVPANTGTYSSVAVNGATTGDLHANGDRDWHRVSLVGGRTYRFNLRGRDSGGGTLANPFLQLRNSGGTVVAQDNDSGTGLDSSLRYRPTNSGTFMVAARASNNTGTGSYRLGVTQIA